MRLAGITLPGNGLPVSGSKIVTGPCAPIDCEKSPVRSSRVGMVWVLVVPLRVRAIW